MSERVLVGEVEALPEGSQTAVEVNGLSVLVLCDGGEFHALRNNCTHQNYPLLGGGVADGRITCEKHGAKFEIATGRAKTLPAFKPVQVYRTEVEEGRVYVLPL